VSLSNENGTDQKAFSCPFSVPRFRKWLRGRDLNPRPLGYECNFFVARSFCFLGFRCGSLHSIGEVKHHFPTQLPTRADAALVLLAQSFYWFLAVREPGRKRPDSPLGTVSFVAHERPEDRASVNRM